MVHGKITEADTPTIHLDGVVPIRTTGAHTSIIPPFFMPNALSATTFPNLFWLGTGTD